MVFGDGPQKLSTLLFEIGFLTGLKLSKQARLASQ